MDDELGYICGFARHQMALLRAGDGDEAKGRIVLALRRLTELVERGDAKEDELGDALFEAANAYEHRDRAEAEKLWARALAMPGFRASKAWAVLRYSHALGLQWRGEHARCLPLFEEELAWRRKHARSEDDLPMVLCALAETLTATGRAGEALPLVSEAERVFDRSDWMKQHRPGITIDIAHHRACALDALGRTTEALAAFDVAEQRADGFGTRLELDVWTASADARLRAGRRDEALVRARRALAWFDDVLALRRQRPSEDVSEMERERADLAEKWALDRSGQ